MRTATLALALALAATNVRADFDADVDEVSNDIAELLVKFRLENLVPQPIDDDWLKPIASLQVEYPDAGTIDVGEDVDQDSVQDAPQYTLNIPESQAAAFQGQRFTVIVADPGAPSQQAQSKIVVRHALGNNYTVNSDGQLQNTSALVEQYFGPAPPPGSGPHRYMHLVFAQSNDFRVPSYLSQPGQQVDAKFDLTKYWNDAKLGPIVAASYMRVTNGSTTASTVTSIAPINTADITASASRLESSLAATRTPGPADTKPNAATSSFSSAAPALGLAVSAIAAGIAFVLV